MKNQMESQMKQPNEMPTKPMIANKLRTACASKSDFYYLPVVIGERSPADVSGIPAIPV